MGGCAENGVAESGRGGRLGVGGMRRLAEDVHDERSLPRDEQKSVDYWEERMRTAFSPPETITHREHVTGSHDWCADAHGPRVVYVVDERRVPMAFGGEARFGLRGTDEWEVVGDWRAGDDGYRAGWQVLAAELRGRVAFDASGFPLNPVSRIALDSAELDALPAFLQLVCRARVEVGIVEVFAQSPGKVPQNHISLDVMAQNWIEACAWQARFDLTAAYATDAGTGVQKDGEGRTRFDAAGDPLAVVSQAAARHDGAVVSGVIDPKYGLDNYVGELAALLQAVHDAEAGARVVVVFDATSPVRAWLRFRGRHARHKLSYYARHLLDTFEQLVQKCEVVVLVWQTSHVGSPANEWADLLATLALQRAMVPFPVKVVSFCTLYYTRAERSLFRWALCRGRRAAFGRMSASLSATVFFEAGDIPLGGMVREAEDICRAVRSRTCLLSDRLQRLSKPAACIVREAGCMCGGRWADTGHLVLPTWSHCMFWCEAPAYVVRRGGVAEALQEVALGNAFDGHARGGTHSQLGKLLELLSSAGHVDLNLKSEDGRHVDSEMRRLFGKCVGGSGSKGVDRQSGVRQALRRLVLAGCDLLQTARVWEESTLAQVVEFNCRAYLQRLCFKPWKARWSANGPARVAALAELRRCREAVGRTAAAAVASGSMSNLGRFIAGVRAMRETRRVRVLIELALPGMDSRAPALWCIAAAVRLRVLRRLRTSEEYEGRRGWVRITKAPLVPWSVTMRQMWRAALPGVRLPERARVQRAEATVGGVAVPGAFRDAAAAVGRCLRYGLSGYDVLAQRGRSGVGVLQRVRDKVRRGEDAKTLMVMQARMLKWGRPYGRGTLSGKAKEPLGPLVRLEFKPRSRTHTSAAGVSRRRKFVSGDAADSRQRWAVEGVIEARRSGGIWGLVRWVSAQVERLPGWEDSWVRLLHMSADLRRDTRRLLGTRQRRLPAASRPIGRVGERRSGRVAAKVAAVAAAAEERDRDGRAASDAESVCAGDDVSGAEEEVAIAAGEALVAEVREWKRARGRLWGLVRWEPDPVDGEFPLEWVEERHLGAHWVSEGRAATRRVRGSGRGRAAADVAALRKAKTAAACASESLASVAAEAKARAEVEVVARRARAVVRGERPLAGGKRASGLEAGGEVGRPRTRASQGVGVSGVKRDCGAGSPSGATVAARSVEEEEARCSRAAGVRSRRQLWGGGSGD